MVKLFKRTMLYVKGLGHVILQMYFYEKQVGLFIASVKKQFESIL